MVSCRFGGSDGVEVRLEDQGDLVVVRTHRRGARHDVSPLSRQSRAAGAQLTPLFGFAPAGVGVYEAPGGRAKEVAETLNADPGVQFAGRGLRDQHGAPVVYTENLFVKFVDAARPSECEEAIGALGLSGQAPAELRHQRAYFVAGPEGIGREIFSRAAELLEREDVELCHPELVREVGWNAAFPEQWHLQRTVVDGTAVDAHANVIAAWELTQGEDVLIAIVDDGVDIDHDEFSASDKAVASRSVSPPRSDDPRPAEGSNHGTACAGVACAGGSQGRAAWHRRLG